MKKLFTLLLVLTLTVGLSFASTAQKTGTPGAIEKSIEKISQQAGIQHLSPRIAHVFLTNIPVKKTSQQTLLLPYMNDMITMYWNSQNWENISRNLAIFDNNDQMTNDYYYEWSPNGWVNSSHTAYTNNAAGLPTEAMLQSWDEINMVWEDYAKITYTYNANNLLTQGMIAISFGGSWVDFFKIVLTYNAQDLVIEELTQMYDMMSMGWENDTRLVYTYNANDLVYQEVEQMWDGAAWENAQRTTSTYNANDYVTEDVIEYWDIASWEIVNRMLYSYDSQWNIIEVKDQYYDGTSNYHDDILYTGTYDGQNNPIEWLTQYWDGTAWENDMKDIYNYALPIGLTEVSTTDVALSVYPNPATSATNVSFNLTTTAMVSVNIHDFTGRTIETQSLGSIEAGMHTTTLSTANIAQGYYFITLTNGHNVIAKEKLVIVK